MKQTFQKTSQLDRRRFMQQTAAVGLAAATACAATAQQNTEPAPAASADSDAEWRNKQSGMAYRRLGRTGMMVSEVLSGGDPIRSKNYEHLNLALDMGLNYLDMAPAYGGGDCETAYGKLLGGASSKRQKVFMTTKVSGYKELRNRLYREIFDGLPGSEQEAILQRAKQLRFDRGVEKPGYYLTYWPGQQREFDGSYISNAMMGQYADRVEGSDEFRKHMIGSIESSLKRVGTDYFDILMCPHGACCPEELRMPQVRETFQQLKQQGKVRYLGVTSHNDPAGVVRTATEVGHYDVVMMAYNVINGGYLEEAIRQASAKGVGIIGMKVAMAVATHHKSLQPVPQWRIEKVNRVVPGEMKAPMKAYVWALQNPNISAVISNLWDETFIRENLSLAGKKVELQPA